MPPIAVVGCLFAISRLFYPVLAFSALQSLMHGALFASGAMPSFYANAVVCAAGAASIGIGVRLLLPARESASTPRRLHERLRLTASAWSDGHCFESEPGDRSAIGLGRSIDEKSHPDTGDLPRGLGCSPNQLIFGSKTGTR